MKSSISLLLVLGASFGVFGIGCNEAERVFDCVQICNKYKACVADDLDRSECVDSCEDHGDEDSDFAVQASDCESCLNDTSCTEATAKCTTTCVEVIAKST